MRATWRSRPRAEPASPHRRSFALLSACLVCVGIGQSMLFSILPPAARSIGITPFQVSTIFATSASIWVFVSPWWGRRSDRAGRRPVMLTGLLGFALSMSALALVIDVGMRGMLPGAVVYPLMVAARCIFALVGSGTGPASQAYIADRTSREERTAAIALVSAAMGIGETVGPGVGAALSALGLLAPLYLSAVLATVSAAAIWRYLPEPELPTPPVETKHRRMSVFDRRVLPFLAVSTALQATRATTVITFAFFLQDTLHLTPERTVQLSGIGFVVLASAGLFAQLFVVQRLRPSASAMMRGGVLLMVAAFALLVVADRMAICLLAMALLGLGSGLVRPGASAAASLSVRADEQGSVAGTIGGVAVAGNVVGPMLGTTLYAVARPGPYVLNLAIMSAVAILVWTNRRVRTVRA